MRLTKCLFPIDFTLWDLGNLGIFPHAQFLFWTMSLKIRKGNRLTVLQSIFSCLPRPDVTGSSVFTYYALRHMHLSICPEDQPSHIHPWCKRVSLLPSLFNSFLYILKTIHWGAKSDRGEAHAFVCWAD